MENLDPLDRNLQDGGASQPVQQPIIKREVDSLDDFEHLGHDSSPLREQKQTAEDLLLDLRAESPAGEVVGVINKGDGNAKAAIQLTDDDDDDVVQQHFDRTIQDDIKGVVDNKMDTNLLQMGDSFSDGKNQNEDKLEKILSDYSHSEKSEELLDKEVDVKAATKNFMDFERELIEPKKTTSDLLERYSDSDSEIETQPPLAKKDDDFLPPKTETFKDVVYEEKSEMRMKEAPPKPPSPAPPPPQTTPIPPADNIPSVRKEAEVKKTEPAPSVASKVAKAKSDIIEAEAMFCKMGLDAWFNPERLNPKVENLIYWRDPKKTGPIFGGVLVVLLALTYFSFISVAAYLSLFALTATISFRIYKNIVQAVQKTGDGHPFKEFLEYDISLPKEKVNELSEVAVSHVNAAASELRRLFLVEDLVDSIKFGVLLWCLTYLGSWFNGMTLIIIAWVALFTLPKVYEANKTQIDKNLEIVRTKLAEITSKVKAAIPIGKKAEEKKEQ